MTHDETDDRSQADEVLVASARAGDDSAFAALWRRHARAGTVAARQFAQIADADDLLSEAYLRILKALRQGGGPHGTFRPYLYRTIRNIALDWRARFSAVSLDEIADLEGDHPHPELAAVERNLTSRAFRSLPQNWQAVLWYLDVEGLWPAEAAPILGLSPNATSALAQRAREGLKKAWLQAHVNEAGVPVECRWTTDRMGDYARGGLTRRGRERFASHLEGCPRCTAVLAEIDDVGGRLAVLFLPLLIGGGAATALLAKRSRPESSSTSAASSVAARVALAAGVGALALTGVAGVWAASWQSAPSSAPPDTEPAPEPSADLPTDSPAPTTSPVPPPAEDDAGDSPRRPAQPEVPLDTLAPGVPVVMAPTPGMLTRESRPAFSGSGEPGARVHIDELDSATGALVTVATALVGSDGGWSASLATPLDDGIHEFRVWQSDTAGNGSPPSGVAIDVDTVAFAPALDALPLAPLVFLPTIAGDGEAGATVTLRDETDAVLGSAVVAADGRWAVELPDPVRDGAVLTASQVDRAGNVSALSAGTAPLVFDRPSIPAPVDGGTVPSTGGATVVEVLLAGRAGMRVEVLIDGVGTGNIHTLETDPLERVTPPLGDGAHTIAVRYVDPDAGRLGSIEVVAFVIGN